MKTYANKDCAQFVEDMEEAGLDVKHFNQEAQRIVNDMENYQLDAKALIAQALRMAYKTGMLDQGESMLKRLDKICPED